MDGVEYFGDRACWSLRHGDRDDCNEAVKARLALSVADAGSERTLTPLTRRPVRVPLPSTAVMTTHPGPTLLDPQTPLPPMLHNSLSLSRGEPVFSLSFPQKAKFSRTVFLTPTLLLKMRHRH